MSKPAAGVTPLRWGTAPLIPADLTAPDTTHMDQGWQDREEPPHSYFNYWMNLVYLWLKWIDDGVWTAVSLVLSGALTVNGAAVFNAAAIFNNGLTVASGGSEFDDTVLISGDLTLLSGLVATGASFSNAVTMANGLTVSSGATTLSADVFIGSDVVQTSGRIVATSNSLAHAFGDTQVDGALDVTGATTLAGGVTQSAGSNTLKDTDFDGNVDITGGDLNVSAGTFGVSGNGTVGGDLGVTGNESVGGALSVTGVVNANGGITLAAPTAFSTMGAGILNAWADGSGISGSPPSAYKDAFGVKHLSGTIQSGVTATKAVVLTAGFRPTAARAFPVFNSGGTDPTLAWLTIAANGDVFIYWSGGGTVFIYLDGISYL